MASKAPQIKRDNCCADCWTPIVQTSDPNNDDRPDDIDPSMHQKCARRLRRLKARQAAAFGGSFVAAVAQ